MSIDSLSYGLGFEADKFILGNLCRRKHIEIDSGKSLRYKSNNLCVACNKLTKAEKLQYSTRRIDLDNGFSLGQPCKLNHDWEGTELCLRFTTSRDCVECYKDKLDRDRQPESEKKIVLSKEHYLGKLCLNSHEYENTGKSFRYCKDRGCVECTKERTSHWFANNQGKRKKYLESKKEYFRLNHVKWARNNKDKIYECQRKHRLTEKGKITARKGRIKRVVNMLLIHSVNLSKEDINQIEKRFEGKCAWCNKNIGERITLDHFLAVSKGGSDCKSNLLPCCQSCNSSKSDSDPKKWFAEREFYSKKRWWKILRVLGKTEKNYSQIPFF